MNALIVMKKQHPRYSDNTHSYSNNQSERAALEQQYYEEYGSDGIVLIHRFFKLNRKLMVLLREKLKM